VSQHLKILKGAGLVEDVAAGTRRITGSTRSLAALRDQLDTYWQRALAGYAQAAEAPDEEGH
jgi:DNA-binding transcriptional ArsR family regulator